MTILEKYVASYSFKHDVYITNEALLMFYLKIASLIFNTSGIFFYGSIIIVLISYKMVFLLDVPYEIVVYTSDLSGAGSDSNIFVTLYGSGGQSTDQILLTDTKKKRKECFNRGSVDVFVREVRLKTN